MKYYRVVIDKRVNYGNADLNAVVLKTYHSIRGLKGALTRALKWRPLGVGDELEYHFEEADLEWKPLDRETGD